MKKNKHKHRLQYMLAFLCFAAIVSSGCGIEPGARKGETGIRQLSGVDEGADLMVVSPVSSPSTDTDDMGFWRRMIAEIAAGARDKVCDAGRLLIGRKGKIAPGTGRRFLNQGLFVGLKAAGSASFTAVSASGEASAELIFDFARGSLYVARNLKASAKAQIPKSLKYAASASLEAYAGQGYGFTENGMPEKLFTAGVEIPVAAVFKSIPGVDASIAPSVVSTVDFSSTIEDALAGGDSYKTAAGPTDFWGWMIAARVKVDGPKFGKRLKTLFGNAPEPEPEAEGPSDIATGSLSDSFKTLMERYKSTKTFGKSALSHGVYKRKHWNAATAAIKVYLDSLNIITSFVDQSGVTCNLQDPTRRCTLKIISTERIDRLYAGTSYSNIKSGIATSSALCALVPAICAVVPPIAAMPGLIGMLKDNGITSITSPNACPGLAKALPDNAQMPPANAGISPMPISSALRAPQAVVVPVVTPEAPVVITPEAPYPPAQEPIVPVNTPEPPQNNPVAQPEIPNGPRHDTVCVPTGSRPPGFLNDNGPIQTAQLVPNADFNTRYSHCIDSGRQCCQHEIGTTALDECATTLWHNEHYRANMDACGHLIRTP